jgi:hypothetical protein
MFATLWLQDGEADGVSPKALEDLARAMSGTTSSLMMIADQTEAKPFRRSEASIDARTFPHADSATRASTAMAEPSVAVSKPGVIV